MMNAKFWLAAIWLLASASAFGQNDSIRFLWWGSDVRKQATMEALRVYQTDHPGLKMVGISQPGDQYETRMRVQVAGGTQPDLLQIDPNWLRDFDGPALDSFVDFRKEPIDLTSFDPAILARYCTVNGRLIGLPMGMNSFGLMVNKAAFARFHLSVNTAWTWSKIREEGRRIHQADKNSYLLLLDAQALSQGFFNNYLRSKTGRDWASDEGTLDCSPSDLTEAFRVLKSLFDSHAVVPLGEAMSYELKIEKSPWWRDGKVGMTVDWSGTLLKYKSVLKPGTFAVARPVQVEGGVDTRSVPTKPSMLLAVKQPSPFKAEAVRFAGWFLTDPKALAIVKDVRSVPASKTALGFLKEHGLVDPDMATMMAWADANPAPYTLMVNNSVCIALVSRLCELVIYGKLTPEQAAQKLTEGMTALFSKVKMRG